MGSKKGSNLKGFNNKKPDTSYDLKNKAMDWIPADEENKPEANNIPVLCLVRDESISEGYLRIVAFPPYGARIEWTVDLPGRNYNTLIDPERVKYWMPLPDFPKS